MIFLVSGGFQSGLDKVDSERFGAVVLKPFLDRGQTVFAVSHSDQPKFNVIEIVPDIHRSVRFIRVHAKDYGVDPDRLGIMGRSSGGSGGRRPWHYVEIDRWNHKVQESHNGIGWHAGVGVSGADAPDFAAY